MELAHPYTAIQPPSPIAPFSSQSSPGLLDIPQSAPPESFEFSDVEATSQPPGSAGQRWPRSTSSNLTPNLALLRPGRSPSEARSATSVSVAPNENGLSHLDVPRKFGEAAEYWKVYDELSDKYDKDLNKMLSANLDILLIFAGLFSAVNTAFIVLSLEDLSPPPDDRVVQLLNLLVQGKVVSEPPDLSAPDFAPSDQAIRVNSCLSASLACSLLAAFGAVMAKQWVLHYTRSTVGTLETQGRLRQQRLNGVKKYRFRYAVESLPILLQLSLILFFIGLLDYLRSLNSTVAYVVLAFSIAGVVVYVVTVFMASIDPRCPFQTPVSIFMRKICKQGKKAGGWYFDRARTLLTTRWRHQDKGPGKTFLANLVLAGAVAFPFIQPLGQAAEPDDDAEEELDSGARAEALWEKQRNASDEEDKIDNQTACWIVVTSEHKDALISAARNIPSLRNIQSTALSVDGVAFDVLLSLFRESLAASRAASGHIGGTGSLEAAIVYGRALCHSVIGSRSASMEPLAERCQDLQWHGWRKSVGGYDTNEFFLMKACVKASLPRGFCVKHPKDALLRPSSALPIYIAALLEPCVERKDFRISASWLDRLTLIHWLISTSLGQTEFWFPNTVNLSAWALGNLPLLLPDPGPHIDEELRKRWWGAYTTDFTLYLNFIKALEVYHHYVRLPDALNQGEGVPLEFTAMVRTRKYIKTYKLLVQAVRNFIDTDSRQQEMLSVKTLELDTALRQTVRTVQHQIDSHLSPDGESLTFHLEDLRHELEKTLQSLRKDGIEAMFQQLGSSDNEAQEVAIPEEPHCLHLLRDSPKLPETISKALKHRRESTRYAALAIVHDHGHGWFGADEEKHHEEFKKHDFVARLASCLNNEEDFELVSGILAQLVDLGRWRKEIVEAGTLTHFHDGALRVLDKRPTLRGLEVYLRVWQSCSKHTECKLFVEKCKAATMVPALMGWLRRIATDKRIPQPYVPPTLKEYVEHIKQASVSEEMAALESVYAELKELSAHFWWKKGER